MGCFFEGDPVISTRLDPGQIHPWVQKAET